MKMSSQLLVAALTVTALSAGTAQAAGLPAQDLTARGTAQLPADVSARDCVQGGGMIIVAASGDGANSFTKRCQGGTHDGETIT
ncbi:hypothetical protein [Streptomyces sp. DH24]|uniref:hypothetical protein n=1 Tax=Streptomyces sp. DH24 TaxID=3040123 RepID=UPI0024418F38|nr:hypothetical protein [Streptomyces sp. DH24]MDG9715387.1 hypothetical protein [Streptomyces sp. DH24]